MLLLFVVVVIKSSLVVAWPDGAPCLRTALVSMNPLEADEHAGGLQLTDPPYHIELDARCYWKSQPVGITLSGNNTEIKFKGFAMQPIVYRGSMAGRRFGQFIRLDGSGSWRQQCFRYKDSITHSHDEDKNRLEMWWKSDDDDEQYVQFVATVVHSRYRFWVKSVVSTPIPPCRFERQMSNYQKQPVTPPPDVKLLKQQQLVSDFNIDPAPVMQNIAPPPVRLILPPQQQQQRPRPPVQQPFTIRPTFVLLPPQQQQQSRFIITQTIAPRRQMLPPRQPVPQLKPGVCADIEPSTSCAAWRRYCGASTHLAFNCKRTCGLC